MSTKPGLTRSQGKGDGWRVKLSTFQEAISKVKTGQHESSGKLFLKKNNRTVITYK